MTARKPAARKPATRKQSTESTVRHAKTKKTGRETRGAAIAGTAQRTRTRATARNTRGADATPGTTTRRTRTTRATAPAPTTPWTYRDCGIQFVVDVYATESLVNLVCNTPLDSVLVDQVKQVFGDSELKYVPHGVVKETSPYIRENSDHLPRHFGAIVIDCDLNFANKSTSLLKVVNFVQLLRNVFCTWLRRKAAGISFVRVSSAERKDEYDAIVDTLENGANLDVEPQPVANADPPSLASLVKNSGGVQLASAIIGAMHGSSPAAWTQQLDEETRGRVDTLLTRCLQAEQVEADEVLRCFVDTMESGHADQASKLVELALA